MRAAGLLPPLFSLPFLGNCKHLSSLIRTHFYTTPSAASLPLFPHAVSNFNPFFSLHPSLSLDSHSTPLSAHVLDVQILSHTEKTSPSSDPSDMEVLYFLYSSGLLHCTPCH